jgi:hypothetical protein
LETVQALPELTELHASGLPWQDATLLELLESDRAWTGLSVGFSQVTAGGLRDALPHVKDTLTYLALPFMDRAVDNALVGFLGKTLVNLMCLDVRGNSSLSSVTGFFDGRQLHMAERGELLHDTVESMPRVSKKRNGFIPCWHRSSRASLMQEVPEKAYDALLANRMKYRCHVNTWIPLIYMTPCFMLSWPQKCLFLTENL